MYFEESEEYEYKDISKLSISKDEVEQVLTSNYQSDNF